jgi:hypothetical protein
MSPERKVEAHLVKLAKQRGFLCRKLRWIGRNGAPDRVLFTPKGLVIWVEVKAPGKRPSRLQEAEHTRLRMFNQLVYVVDSEAAVEELFA